MHIIFFFIFPRRTLALTMEFRSYEISESHMNFFFRLGSPKTVGTD